MLEEIELSKAFYEVYDGAVYLWQGRPHLCKGLDLNGRIATVRPADIKYYTKMRDYTDVHVTGASGCCFMWPMWHVAGHSCCPGWHAHGHTAGLHGRARFCISLDALSK